MGIFRLIRTDSQSYIQPGIWEKKLSTVLHTNMWYMSYLVYLILTFCRGRIRLTMLCRRTRRWRHMYHFEVQVVQVGVLRAELVAKGWAATAAVRVAWWDDIVECNEIEVQVIEIHGSQRRPSHFFVIVSKLVVELIENMTIESSVPRLVIHLAKVEHETAW